MPKKVYEINPFHGGINTKDDARDILDHQLVDAKGVTVDSKGVLKVIGNAVDLDTTSAYVNTTNEAGYGFARFSSDTNAAGSSGTDATNRDYLIYWDEGDEKLYWYNSTDDAWTEIVDLSTAWSGSARKVIFSYSKGALRACDSNFDNTSNENYWLGTINKTIFKGSNAERVDSGWYKTAASCAKPTTAVVKSEYVDHDNETTAEDVTWVVTSARNETDLIWDGSDSEYWEENDTTGTVQDVIFTNYAGPYGTPRSATLGWKTVNWNGDSDHADTQFCQVDQGDTPSSSGTYWDGFTIDPTKSIYLSCQLPYQGVFDAWGAGWAKTSKTTVQYSNFVVEMWAGDTNSERIVWNISSEDLLKDGLNWFTLELKYAEAFENTLDTDLSMERLKFAFDTNIVRSDTDDWANTRNWSAISLGDMRQGEPNLVGKDLLGIKKLAYSFCYDEQKTESILTDLGDFDFGNSLTEFAHSIQFGAQSFTNKRIQGATLYVYDNEEPYMLAEADFVKGLRGSWEGDWPGTDSSTSQWTSSGDQSSSVSSNKVSNPNVALVETYQARNGFSHKEEHVDARYKSIVITNNRAYAGNIYINGKHYPDKMIKSQVGDLDIFPENGRAIDVVEEDGDSIIAMAAYADRIFQFKRKKLHIINIAEMEFLEDSHMGQGVDTHQWVVQAEKGIAWFNKFGAYFFDGNTINNLVDGLIDNNTWDTFVTASGSKGKIFYDPIASKIQIFAGTLLSNAPTENYEFSLITKGWSRGINRFMGSGANSQVSNPVLDVDGITKFFQFGTGKVFKWVDTPTAVTSNFEIITGDKVFDSSAIRKKIYRIHITHKNIGSATVTVYGRADRGSWVSLGTLSDYSNFTVQEFDVSGMSNARSFQVKLARTANSVPVDFEINDINIIYRSKNVR